MDDNVENKTFEPKIEVFSAFTEPFSKDSDSIAEVKPIEACCACTACTACTACG